MQKWFAQLALSGVLAAATLTAMAILPVATASAAAAEMEVKIDNFIFNPPRITVKAGTAVKWVNGDDAPHTVASTTKAFRSKALDTGDQFSFTFMAPGVYEYFCSLHPHMTGTIVVEAAAASAATP